MQGLSSEIPTILLLSTILLLCASRTPKCDARTRPPTDPSFQDCQDLLWSLSIKAHREPTAAYRWYGRRLDPCDECVKLPTIVHFGRQKCAALIDVDDKHDDEVSIFGLRELWQASSDVVAVCWLGQRHNGLGYPGGHMAWAGFVKGTSLASEVLGIEMVRLGDGTKRRGGRRVTILDLGEGWPRNTGYVKTAGTANVSSTEDLFSVLHN